MKIYHLDNGEHKYWAVITGASDGIGLSFARALAKKSYNLLLIGRNFSKLQSIAEILKHHDKDIEIEILAVDFENRNIYNVIRERLQEMENIKILINNVGICYPGVRPEFFHQIEDLDNFIDKIINVNIVSHTKMISIVLNRMIDNKDGIIINMSSSSAISPIPLLAIYSATKVS